LNLKMKRKMKEKKMTQKEKKKKKKEKRQLSILHIMYFQNITVQNLIPSVENTANTCSTKVIEKFHEHTLIPVIYKWRKKTRMKWPVFFSFT
jgi:hypothetical protein